MAGWDLGKVCLPKAFPGIKKNKTNIVVDSSHTRRTRFRTFHAFDYGWWVLFNSRQQKRGGVNGGQSSCAGDILTAICHLHGELYSYIFLTRHSI